MPLWTPHLWLPDQSLYVEPLYGLTFFARSAFLRHAAVPSGPITFVDSAVDTVINSGTLSITLPGTLVANDIVIAFCATSAGTVATPSGWTEIHSDGSINATNDQGGAYYKIMPSTPDTSVSFWDSGSGTSEAGAGLAFAFRGVDTGNPVDTSAEYEGTDTNSSTPAVTPSSNDCCIMTMTYINHTAVAITPPTNYTAPTNWTAFGDDTENVVVSGAYRILVGGAGAPEDPSAFGWGGGTGSATKYGVTVALRRAS
jgi:hypothetical protein